MTKKEPKGSVLQVNAKLAKKDSIGLGIRVFRFIPDYGNILLLEFFVFT